MATRRTLGPVVADQKTVSSLRAGTPTAVRIDHALRYASANRMVSSDDKVPVDKKLVSARLSVPLLDAARKASGISNTTDLVTAALAAMVAPNFGEWLLANAGTLPKDFELDV